MQHTSTAPQYRISLKDSTGKVLQSQIEYTLHYSIKIARDLAPEEMDRHDISFLKGNNGGSIHFDNGQFVHVEPVD